MDPSQKKNLVNSLNKAAVKKRDHEMDTAFHRAAADVLRHRLVVCESTAAAKLYMESSSNQGLKARVTYIDFTQASKLQTKGSWSKQLCLSPDKAFSTELASKIAALPMTSIVGSALIRSGGAHIENFTEVMKASMPYPRTLFVPIDLPSTLKKHLVSAQKRALGPLADDLERSGVEFTMRTIGARNVDTPEGEEEGDGDEAEQSDDDMGDDDDQPKEDADDNVGSLESMTPKQMKGAFGREALQVLGAMFQHQSKICAQARFLEKKDYVFQVKENGKKAMLRKACVLFYRARHLQ